MTTAVMKQANPAQLEATINYFPKEGGTTSYIPGSVAFYKRKFTPTTVRINDIRGTEAGYSLDKQGFQLVRHESKQRDYSDVVRIRDFYFPETEDLVKRVTGATTIKTFSHEVRSVDLDSVMKRIDDERMKDDELIIISPPAMYAHVDNGPDWAWVLFRHFFGREESERLKSHRWAIVNSWRPIKPVTRDPLAFCDSASIQDDDLVSVYAKATAAWGNSVEDFTNTQAEIHNVKANPLHRWYYASAMEPDEVLLLTNFDTKKTVDGHLRRVVHSAFSYKTEDSAPTRESIELRHLLVWEDEPTEEM